ncbi:MAG TPA: DivIVA domain-containing protein [Acidimicrobiales bacterium]|nr:DivIVA domain-containing protein [Acidimicrobiales bacterium]
MTITPEEIEHKQFMPAVRGYDREEVDAFLRAVAADLRRLTGELEQASERASAVERDSYDRLGTEVANILRSARDAADATTEEARHAAERTLGEAAEEADRIRREAQAEAERLRAEADDALRAAMDGRARVDAVIADLAGRLEVAEDLMRQLRSELTVAGAGAEVIAAPGEAGDGADADVYPSATMGAAGA